mgnify:CR=1 FL=1|jgi:nicotinamidase-related amidase
MSKSALLVIDVQNDVVARAFEREQVIEKINTLVKNAREASIPVIWVQHSDDYLVKGTDGWEFVDELQPGSDEVRIFKTQPSSFENTPLLEELRVRSIDHIVVTGAQTDFCINATSNAGVDLGFAVTLVSDAHTTEDTTTLTAKEIIQEKNHTFTKIGAVVSASEVTF